MQIVFQDPFGSLSPRMSVAEIVGEGLSVHYLQQQDQHQQQIIDALVEVGIDLNTGIVIPMNFLEGNDSELLLHGALVLKPTFMVLDEPTSALDRTIQSQIIEHYESYSKNIISYLFISHDLAVIRAMSHRIMVMQQGQIIEQGLTQQIFEAPSHPYTKTLIQASQLVLQ